VPLGSQAWEVTPGEVRALRSERVLGGTKVYVPEFGLTTAIVLTSDTSMVIHFQEQCRAMRQSAAEWTYELAVQEFQKVLRVEEQLEKDNHKLPDGPALIKDARDRLASTKQYWDSRRYTDCYREGQRVLRPVRILMRGQFDQAVKDLNNPVSSPYAVSFYTLPRHYQFMAQFKTGKSAGNVLKGGSFEEEAPGQPQEIWTPQETTTDDVVLRAERVKKIEIELPKDPKVKPVPAPVGPRQDLPVVGKQCLMLEIKPKNKEAVPQALERTFLAINSPTVHLQPGTPVKISAWIRIPKALTATSDGALIYDSAGGEPLAYHLHDATIWALITLYRRVPASGTINVTVALTGIGAVYFDDIKIEPMQVAPATAALQR
jgi:hypothetical protein